MFPARARNQYIPITHVSDVRTQKTRIGKTWWRFINDNQKHTHETCRLASIAAERNLRAAKPAFFVTPSKSPPYTTASTFTSQTELRSTSILRHCRWNRRVRSGCGARPCYIRKLSIKNACVIILNIWQRIGENLKNDSKTAVRFVQSAHKHRLSLFTTSQ